MGLKRPRTIKEGLDNELPVLFYQVVDVAEDATVAENIMISKDAPFAILVTALRSAAAGLYFPLLARSPAAKQAVGLGGARGATMTVTYHMLPVP